MRRFYTRQRRLEAQGAICRKRAEARVESLRFLETITGESEQSMELRSESSITVFVDMPLIAIPAMTQFLVELHKLLSEPLPAQNTTAESRSTAKPTTSRTGYLNWAIERLMKDVAVGGQGLWRPFDQTDRVVTPEQLQEALMVTRLDEDDTDQTIVGEGSSMMDEAP